jgi:hypothetical protein
VLGRYDALYFELALVQVFAWPNAGLPMAQALPLAGYWNWRPLVLGGEAPELDQMVFLSEID